MSGADLDERGIPDLAGDVLRAAFGLGRNTARMFRFEARDVARRAGRRVTALIVSSALAASGVLLVLTALALLADEALGLPLWLGILLVGALALAGGALGVRAAMRRLGDADLAFPETFAELTKDVEALSAPREPLP